MQPRPLRLARTLPLLAALSAGALALSGCAPSGPAASPSPSAGSETPRPGATSPGATPGGPATPTGTSAPVTSAPIALTCEDLLTLDDVYAFNPNTTAGEPEVPRAGSAAERILAAGGLQCTWINNSSRDTISIAVAKIADPESLEELKNLAWIGSTQVSTYTPPADEGYFTAPTPSGDPGVAQVFAGEYWFSFSSVDFIEPGALETLVPAAVEHALAS